MGKLHFLYLNYFSIPEITNPKEKIKQCAISFDVLNHLVEEYNVTLIDHIGVETEFKEKGIQYYFRKKTKNNKYRVPWKLHSFIRKLSPNILFVQGIIFMHYVWLLKKLFKINPLVIVQHHAELVPKQWWKRKLLERLDSCIDQYIFTSKEMANQWVSRGIISSIDKVFEQPELSSHFTCDSEFKKDENLFISVARLNKNKDLKTIIRGFSRFLKQKPKAKLLLFYTENILENELKKLVKTLQIGSQIEFKGQVPREELEQWYQKSTYFVLGSYYEGGSAALIEAMACGCIPIISNISSNRSITKNGKYGVLFEPGNVKDFSQKLNELKDLNIKKMRADIQLHFKNNLSFKALANGIKSIVNQLYLF